MVADKKIQKIFIKAETLLDKGETKDAIYFYNKAAKKGHAKAQFKLGLLHLNLFNDLKDTEYAVSAVEWLISAAEGGYNKAYKFLSEAYNSGNSYLVKDMDKAAKYALLAAEQGSFEMASVVADYCLKGLFDERNIKKAFLVIKSFAKEGDGRSENNLACLYAAGVGVLKDMEKAFYWFERAAVSGEAGAQLTLGYCYLYGDAAAISGKFSVQDQKKAFYWFKKSAEQKNSVAQERVGLFYAHGEVVEKNIKTSFYWWRLSERQGNFMAKLHLGIGYIKGEGINGPSDPKTGFKLIKEASGKEPSALFMLAICYAQAIGVEENPFEAINALKQAAEFDVAEAQHLLGCMYIDGYYEIEPDYDLARYWLKRASKLGCSDIETLEDGIIDAEYTLSQIINTSTDDEMRIQIKSKVNIKTYKQMFLSLSNEDRKDLMESLGHEPVNDLRHIFEKSIETLIEIDENEEIEFKETFFAPSNIQTTQQTPHDTIQYQALKEIAGFLNSRDGTLLIGVADKKNTDTDSAEIRGIEPDKDSQDHDKYAIKISQLVKFHMGANASDCISISFMEINSKTVCRINCKKSLVPTYFSWNKENPKEQKTINDKKTGNSVVKVKDKKGEYPLIRTGSEVYQPTHREWVKWVNTKFTKN